MFIIYINLISLFLKYYFFLSVRSLGILGWDEIYHNLQLKLMENFFYFMAFN